MTPYGFCGLPRRTMVRVRARGVLSPATASRLLIVARRVIAPDVVGIEHARGVYYDPAALGGLLDRVAAAEAEACRMRRLVWRRTLAAADFSNPTQQTCEP